MRTFVPLAQLCRSCSARPAFPMVSRTSVFTAENISGAEAAA